MRKETVISYGITAILFIGVGLYFTGVPDSFKLSGMSLPENTMPKWASKDVATAPMSTEKGKKKSKRSNRKRDGKVGKVIDQLSGVNIYYNGNVSSVKGRAVTKDGYNLGLKYQCVEFVKRYYYEELHHKMPDSYGHAKDFFDLGLANASYNEKRGLIQYRNKTFSKPKFGDILVFGGNQYNSFGHVAIVSKVSADHIEIAQQNPGPKNSSRAIIPLFNRDGIWELRGADILGWLRKV